MTLADTADVWLAAHYDDLVAWRRHIHAHPELGARSSPPPSSSPRTWPTPA